MIKAELASLDCRPEYVGVLSVVIPELKFGDVQMQIFLADLVVGSDNAALQDRLEALNRIGVNCADDMLTNGVIDGLVRESAGSASYIPDRRQCRAS
jgi:hypothetical protein